MQVVGMRRFGAMLATVPTLGAITTPALAEGMMQGHGGFMSGGAGCGAGCGAMVGMMGEAAGYGPMMEDLAQRMEGRLAFIEAKFAITDDQRLAWDAFAAAMREAAGGMAEQHAPMASMDATPPLPERLALMEQGMAKKARRDPRYAR